ncbi:unnamed protein product [Clonostachys rosea]|uniref:L-ornithine N(5)-oxygenase n=1 Tax=Bionectria ochroleuca TaxID=29856 RepID=A0ABY6UY06_BIOOC|nr:unnamed protein product [Clonostachys rosea]
MGGSYDVIVVGAGWYGLAAAKAYLHMHPYSKLAILEAGESCGGTWSRNRLYPSLKSNNCVGTYEFPDFPMSEEIYGLKPPNHIPGAVLFRYLTDYARYYGILDMIQFHTRVDLVQPSGDGWRLLVTGPRGVKPIETDRLIIAAGLTNTPNIPSYPGLKTFGAPFFHVRDFCQEMQVIRGVKSAIVVGGGKSAFDTAYALVEDGTEVDMIIRSKGRGPAWISPPVVTIFKKFLDRLLNVRWVTWFSPCPWGAEDGFPQTRQFLHQTRLGRFLVGWFWKTFGNYVVSANSYDSHPEVKKLKPWHSSFWIGSRLSILNYDKPIFDFIKQGKIRVHVDEIESLDYKRAFLVSGSIIDTDALICATGWKKNNSIRIVGLGNEGLGLPFNKSDQRLLEQKADERILYMFPSLANQPEISHQHKGEEPVRYYRFMVPPTLVPSRNLAFAGMVSSVASPIIATIQGLWISTFFDGHLDRAPHTLEEVTYEVMLHTQWGKWRYPCGYGSNIPDLGLDGIPYANMLMRDLGLRVNRKPTIYAELTSPYVPADFRGLSEEWERAHEKNEKEYWEDYGIEEPLKIVIS